MPLLLYYHLPPWGLVPQFFLNLHYSTGRRMLLRKVYILVMYTIYRGGENVTRKNIECPEGCGHEVQPTEAGYYDMVEHVEELHPDWCAGR